MRFPGFEQLQLPCTFEQVIPGRLHADGQRYLPLILLRLPAPDSGLAFVSDPAMISSIQVGTLPIVDRHHVVDQRLVGCAGVARVVFLLSNVRLQVPPLRQGLVDEADAEQGMGMAPSAYGRVVDVLTWEAEQTHLPYEALYTELLLDIGVGVIGVRTNATSARLEDSLGKARIEPGDWLRVWRSRVDILGFEARAAIRL